MLFSSVSKKKDIIVGMSGGVDSTVAVYLLQQQSYNVLGVTLRLADNYLHDKSKQNEVIAKAKAVCNRFGIEHVVADQTSEFDEFVVKYFAQEYFKGATPNPCVQCNLHLKWNALLRIADERGIDKIATGHYAKIEEKDSKFSLLKGEDRAKDQSYFLWRLTQEQLSRTVFPLGSITKDKIKAIAKDLDLPQSNQAESQDVCFIPDNDYKEFLSKYFPEDLKKISQGNFIDMQGNVIGKHMGYYRFTIGQRKGLGIALGEPAYVRSIDAKTNTVQIGMAMDMDDLGCTIKDLNWMGGTKPTSAIDVLVKIRYRNAGVMARMEPLENGNYHLTFGESVKAVTPGQSAVFYKDEQVLGGGIIVLPEIERS